MDAFPSPPVDGSYDWNYMDRIHDFHNADGSAVLAGFTTLFATIIFEIFLFQTWRVAGDASRGSAIWAVLRQFIPLFHVYGLFAGLIGLARKLNSEAQRQGAIIKPVSVTLAGWTAFLLVACLAPFLGIIAAPAASMFSVAESCRMTLTGTASPAVAVLRGILIAVPGTVCLLLFTNSVYKAARALAKSE